MDKYEKYAAKRAHSVIFRQLMTSRITAAVLVASTCRFSLCEPEQNEEILLAQVVFRHGAKVPDVVDPKTSWFWDSYGQSGEMIHLGVFWQLCASQ